MTSAALKSTAAVAVAVASGLILAAAFPGCGVAPLAWVGLVPLFLSCSGVSPWRAVLLAYVAGAAFFLVHFDWIRVIPGYRPLHHFLLAVYLGSFFAWFGLAFGFIARRRGCGAALVAAPFLWVPLEYLRSNLGFLALPWGLLGHSQHTSTRVLQTASLAGVYGLSFLIVLANAAAAGLLLHLLSRLPPDRRPMRATVSLKAASALTAAAFLLVAAAWVHGDSAIRRPLTGRSVRLALVQGNIPQSHKWDPAQADAILQTYEELTLAAAEKGPDLIVWPESATPRSITLDAGVFQRVKRLAQDSRTHLLLGSSRAQKLNLQRPERTRYSNSAFLISPDPNEKPGQRYDKIRLFPFGEYLPYRKTIPWETLGVPAIGEYLAGREYSVFQLSGFRFSMPICWENLFPQMVRRFVQNGAQFIVNITNESWFDGTMAGYQFLAMNVFRAVENGLYVVRCANTGISCMIDPRGRVVDRVQDGNGRDVGVKGHLTGEVILPDSNTFYTRHGDWLVWVCTIMSCGFIAAAALGRSGVRCLDGQVPECEAS